MNSRWRSSPITTTKCRSSAPRPVTGHTGCTSLRGCQKIMRSEKFRCIPLISRKIRLFGRKNTAVGQCSGICADQNEIKYLEGRVWACQGPDQGFFAVFPGQTGEPGGLRTMTEASFRDIDRGRTTAVARAPCTRWCERGDRGATGNARKRPICGIGLPPLPRA